MKCDDFRAQEILARCDAAGHREIDPSAVGNHAVDAPGAGGIESVFEDFEPFLVGGGCASCVVDFCPVATSAPVAHFAREKDRGG